MLFFIEFFDIADVGSQVLYIQEASKKIILFMKEAFNLRLCEASLHLKDSHT